MSITASGGAAGGDAAGDAGSRRRAGASAARIDASPAGAAARAPAALRNDRRRVEHREAVGAAPVAAAAPARSGDATSASMPTMRSATRSPRGVERAGVDLDHRARDARPADARATRAYSASSKPRRGPTQLEVGLAVDRAHRGAELGERRLR